MTGQDAVDARREIVLLLCQADRAETVPLPTIMAMAQRVVDAGYRRPEGDHHG